LAGCNYRLSYLTIMEEKMGAKKTKDYVKQEEETTTLAGRIPVWKKKLLDQKMAKDGIRKTQDLINAMVDRYLAD